jgi:hypothetical protein
MKNTVAIQIFHFTQSSITPRSPLIPQQMKSLNSRYVTIRKKMPQKNIIRQRISFHPIIAGEELRLIFISDTT